MNFLYNIYELGLLVNILGVIMRLIMQQWAIEKGQIFAKPIQWGFCFDEYNLHRHELGIDTTIRVLESRFKKQGKLYWENHALRKHKAFIESIIQSWVKGLETYSEFSLKKYKQNFSCKIFKANLAWLNTNKKLYRI